MTDTDTPRLLLIEDNPGDARYIEELLDEARAFSERSIGPRADRPSTDGGGVNAQQPSEPDGAPFVHETRLEAGLDRLAAETLDVVLLDLNLPDSDGLETLQRVVEHAPRIPVVVLTGLRDREIGIEALRQGAEEYLVKDDLSPDLLIRSVYHAIERKAHEREQKRYETLIEEAADANTIVSPDGTIKYATPSVRRILGYDPDELVHRDVFSLVHPDDEETLRDAFETFTDGRSTAEFRLEHADGSWVVLDARARDLQDDPAIGGIVVYTHDVTERRERERRLKQQRQRLAAINQLNGVVHSVTGAVVDRSTRTEIEQTACNQLAASDSYEFAWIGTADPRSQTLTVNAQANLDGCDDLLPPTDADESRDRPANRALKTGEVVTVQDVTTDAEYGLQEAGANHGFEALAAIPIVHEDTVYGVLTVYSARTGAFWREERNVVAHLGEIIGHAIAAAERKRALMSDTLVELGFHVEDAITAPDGTGLSDPVELERVIPVGDDTFLIYGETSAASVETIRSLTELVEAWESVSVVSEQLDGVRFELRLSSVPIMSEVASLGGSIDDARIEGRDIQMTVHLPEEVEVRQVIETIDDRYDTAELIARRRIDTTDDTSERLQRVWADDLTDRQRTVIEAAYAAGYFKWPRESSGEDVADSLGIAAPTFSQHLRAAEDKVFGRIFDDDPSSDEEAT
ncbi:bacterio-opsin activator domain-containing protein [Halarchaeum sp. P4]|uniref:bacterio-opsin activator domain-containing protein n=1 Tax=Halarchaeum sp. P4 TaxID=3421639 RepID=UPI003EBB4C9B